MKPVYCAVALRSKSFCKLFDCDELFSEILISNPYRRKRNAKRVASKWRGRRWRYLPKSQPYECAQFVEGFFIFRFVRVIELPDGMKSKDRGAAIESALADPWFRWVR